jgi:hypothetical protein
MSGVLPGHAASGQHIYACGVETIPLLARRAAIFRRTVRSDTQQIAGSLNSLSVWLSGRIHMGRGLRRDACRASDKQGPGPKIVMSSSGHSAFTKIARADLVE